MEPTLVTKPTPHSVLTPVNRMALRPVDTVRLMSISFDFTPSFLDRLGSRSVDGPLCPLSQLGLLKQPRKLFSCLPVKDDMQLNKAEKAWRPSLKKYHFAEEDTEQAKTEEVLRQLRSILNKLTPQKFQELTKQVTDLKIDTEERLTGAIALIFEKAIAEPNFSETYAKMCHCLMGLKVPNSDKPGVASFCRLLLNCCQKEFEKDKADDEMFEKKKKALEASRDEKEQELLRVEMEEARYKARRRSLGNIKFIGELFKLQMLKEAIMHDCVEKLLKDLDDEESLECLCRLLSTIGKDLDTKTAQLRMNNYFKTMNTIIQRKKTSIRTRFMLQDLVDLRKNDWAPRRGDLGPKTIDQIHEEAAVEEQREQINVQEQLKSKKEKGDGRKAGSNKGNGPHSPGYVRFAEPQAEEWNGSENRAFDPIRLIKITKNFVLKLNDLDLAPSKGKPVRRSWSKGCSGGAKAKPASGNQDSGQSATMMLDWFLAPQKSGSWTSPTDTDDRVSIEKMRPSSSCECGGDDTEWSDRHMDWFERFTHLEKHGGGDNRSSRNQIPTRSPSKELQEHVEWDGGSSSSSEVADCIISLTDDMDEGNQDFSDLTGDLTDDQEISPTPSPLPEPALTEDEVETRTNAIIEEYLHIRDLQEALQCVAELNSAALLYVFVRNGIELTLERGRAAREHLGLLLHQLIKTGTLPTQQYYKGLKEILEVAEDMAIEIPYIWLYLAELIIPMLQEESVPMGQLFREISKPLVPLGKAAVLLVQILRLLCTGMTGERVGDMWKAAGLNWSDFLPKDEDVVKFVNEQKVEYTIEEGEDSGSEIDILEADSDQSSV